MNPAFQLCVVLVLFKDGVSQGLSEISQKFTSHPNWKLLNVLDVCGRPARTFVKKIVGGEDAKLGQFPWMAFLINYYGNLNCGGSIINHRYILTAAHCGPSLALVVLGEYQVKYEEVDTADCEGNICAPLAQDYNIEEIECHYFTEQNLFDDICLIRLDRNIQFNDFVNPICLPFYTHLQEKRFDDEYMQVAGWGTVNISMQYPKTLQVLKVPVVNQQSCAELWRELNETVVDTQMCTFDRETPKAPCRKDSGGPLMKRLNVGHGPLYFQFGIVSWGDPICDHLHALKEIVFKPAVYTRVVSYLEWILDHIHE